ncbi:hypothetical protein B0A69_21510 [Chryseobacterium shigense]|uniref:Uncharacterized protein n=1 Tax=Chryseobacterium shigense TaxID=297244 RepID=A0A1N7IJ68_9FLAO|nr:hypothetical protein [Chryseobacterium shigense]PQA90001.1 hypothetical protein B0A69_21510 [Chryseobacterium shigense]SIS37154.1 hypothetical protein SAMN05421639_10432 [Chryseobacterium shigense]
MSTNKNTLAKMSTQELEQYVKPESRFVPEAIQYAYEILQSRGKMFSPEEEARINSMVSKMQKEKEVIIHPHHTKAANIMYLSGVLSIATMIWTYEDFKTTLSLLIGVAILAFIFGMGYLAGKGTEWVKLVLLITFLLGLLGLPSIYLSLFTNPVVGILSSIQTILQVWVLVLLFKVKK